MNASEKLAAAITWLGPRWVFHAKRRIKRIPPGKQLSMHKADVGATFRRELDRLGQGA